MERSAARLHMFGQADVLTDRNRTSERRLEELIKALDRERSEATDLHRRHTEETKRAHERDRQVLIERRRQPR